jgi:hypothetical protein
MQAMRIRPHFDIDYLMDTGRMRLLQVLEIVMIMFKSRLQHTTCLLWLILYLRIRWENCS